MVKSEMICKIISGHRYSCYVGLAEAAEAVLRQCQEETESPGSCEPGLSNLGDL